MKNTVSSLPRALIASNKIDKKLKSFIESLGIEVIPSIDNSRVSKNIMDHPDISIYEIDKNILLIENIFFEDYQKILRDFDLVLLRDEEEFAPDYPRDSYLNVFKFKNYFLHSKFTSKALERELKARSFKKLLTKQGYSNCSSLNIGNQLVITEDKSIAKTLEEAQESYLLVNKGEIHLEGYDYGFIGGCGIQLSKSHFLFTGNIEKLSYYKDLIRVLDENNLSPLYPDLEMVDYGGFIPIY